MDACRARRMVPRFAALIGCLAALSACTPGRATVFAPFALGPTGEASRAGAPAGVARGPVVAVGEPTGKAVARDGGVLTVRFDHVVAGATRKLMATADDVQRVTVRIEGTGVDHTETITRAMLNAGTTSVTFSGLPAVALKVTILALDAGGAVIGQDVQHATVTAGQTTVVASQVLIAPTVANPRVIVTSGGGGTGGGGTGGATGGLTADVTLVDGGQVHVPPLEGVYMTGMAGIDVGQMALSSDGTVWITGGPNWLGSDEAAPMADRMLGGRLYKVVAGGVPAHLPIADPRVPTYPYAAWQVSVSPVDGRVAVSKSYLLANFNRSALPADARDAITMDTVMIKPDASQAMIESSLFFDRFAFDPSGELWTDDPFGISHYDPVSLTLGAMRGTGPGPAHSNDPYGHKLAFDGANGCWKIGPRMDLEGTAQPWYALEKMGPDGQEVFNVTLDGEPFADFAIDGGHIWHTLPTARTIVKRTLAGVEVGSYRSAARFNRVFVDSFHRVWAYQSALTRFTPFTSPVLGESGAADDLVTCFNPDGTLQGYYHIGIGADLTELIVTPDGTMWAGTASKGLLKLHVGTPGTP